MKTDETKVIIMPPEVMAQLKGERLRSMEPEIKRVLEIAGEPKGLDFILTELYATHSIVVKRVTLNATLNRLVKDGKIRKIAGKKAIFAALKPVKAPS